MILSKFITPIFLVAALAQAAINVAGVNPAPNAEQNP